MQLLLFKAHRKQLTRVSWRQLKSANGPAKWAKCFSVSELVKEKT